MGGGVRDSWFSESLVSVRSYWRVSRSSRRMLHHSTFKSGSSSVGKCDRMLRKTVSLVFHQPTQYCPVRTGSLVAIEGPEVAAAMAACSWRRR